MSKIKQFIRYFLIFVFICALPSFVLADETGNESEGVASIKIIKKLLPGTQNGTFTFSLTEIGTDAETGETTNTVINNNIAITTHDAADTTVDQGKIGEITIDNLKPNTEYIIEETNIPEAYKFVSLESGSKIITNSRSISITTGSADSTTEVTAINGSNTSGIENNKNTIEHADGTSTLSLSVTGKASTTVTSSGANILIIYDTSQSMTNAAYARISVTSSDYKPDQVTYYQNNDGSGQLYWVCNSNTHECALRTGRYTTSPLFTGDYVYYRSTRAAEAQRIVTDFAGKLLAKNANLAMVSFDRDAVERKSWTTQNTFLNVFDNTNGWYSVRYTNWEAGFKKGLDEINALNNTNPTYVVFITDGEPTRSDEYGGSGVYNVNHYKAVLNEIQTMTGKVSNIYGIYAFGRNNNNLDDLIYYANACKKGTCQERPDSQGGVTTATVDTDNYYTADDASKLEEAIESIFQNIVSTAGFSNVTVEDGTTSQVKVTTTSGEISSLLEVDSDSSSYVYWLSMPVTKDGANYKLKRKNRETGTEETIIFTQNGENSIIATWGENTYNLEGTIENTSEEYILKYKWTSSVFYDFDNPNVAPPSAVYNTTTGAIDWDLSSLDKLINDVTYTVDLTVWPSQYTQDLIADLMNNPEKYDTLPDNIKDYIVQDGNSYRLRTNTKALITYTDSNNNQGASTFNNPNPIGASQEVISVQKEWEENEVDPDVYNEENYQSIQLYLMRDDVRLPDTITINRETWKKDVYLSLGMIKQTYDGNTPISANIVENGHDYSFVEKDYHWDLDSPTVHPMLIDGTVTMLVKSDMSPSMIDSNNILIQNGKTYYKICNNTCGVYEVTTGNDVSNITVTNSRRSNLNIKKEVIGDYDGTDKFTFTIKVKSTENLWFSVADITDPDNTINIKENNIVTGATLSIDEKTGDYYYEIKGVNMDEWTSVTVKLQENWNIRFTNVPRDTEYEVIESNIPDEGTMVFENITINQNGGTIDKPNKKITGTISESNKIYNIVYQNRYLYTNITVKKEWVDSEEKAVTTNLPNSITVTLTPSSGTASSVDLTADNEWGYTWSNLVKYVSNGTGYDEITYEVTEDKINNITIPENRVFEVKNTDNAIIGRWTLGSLIATGTNSGTEYKLTNIWTEAQTSSIEFVKIAFGTNITDPDLQDLPGAVFKLYRYTGDGSPSEASDQMLIDDNTPNWKLIYTSDGSGRFSFDNLYAGYYRLVETTSPRGYILPSGQWKIVITENMETGALTVENPISINNATAVSRIDNTLYIYNEQIPSMPSTGGIGIYEISLIGLILMAIGNYFLIKSQKEQI